MKRCLIFSAGTFYGMPVDPREGDLVIAADAGYHTCREAGLVPNILLGDFDSTERPDVSCTTISYPAEKNDTDTMLAIRAALIRGYREIHIIGGTGGDRLDHTIANLQALTFIVREGGHGFLYDQGSVFTVVENGTVTISHVAPNALLSVFAIDGSPEGVSVLGTKYSIRNGRLDPYSPVGISNVIVEKTATVTAGSGYLLVGVQIPEKGDDVFSFS